MHATLHCMLHVLAESHIQAALSLPLLKHGSLVAGPLSLPVQRPPGVASAADAWLAASRGSAAGLLASPADAGPAL